MSYFHHLEQINYCFYYSGIILIALCVNSLLISLSTKCMFNSIIIKLNLVAKVATIGCGKAPLGVLPTWQGAREAPATM